MPQQKETEGIAIITFTKTSEGYGTEIDGSGISTTELLGLMAGLNYQLLIQDANGIAPDAIQQS